MDISPADLSSDGKIFQENSNYLFDDTFAEYLKHCDKAILLDKKKRSSNLSEMDCRNLFFIKNLKMLINDSNDEGNKKIIGKYHLIYTPPNDLDWKENRVANTIRRSKSTSRAVKYIFNQINLLVESEVDNILRKIPRYYEDLIKNRSIKEAIRKDTLLAEEIFFLIAKAATNKNISDARIIQRFFINLKNEFEIISEFLSDCQADVVIELSEKYSFSQIENCNAKEINKIIKKLNQYSLLHKPLEEKKFNIRQIFENPEEILLSTQKIALISLEDFVNRGKEVSAKYLNFCKDNKKFKEYFSEYFKQIKDEILPEKVKSLKKEITEHYKNLDFPFCLSLILKKYEVPLFTFLEYMPHVLEDLCFRLKNVCENTHIHFEIPEYHAAIANYWTFLEQKKTEEAFSILEEMIRQFAFAIENFNSDEVQVSDFVPDQFNSCSYSVEFPSGN